MGSVPRNTTRQMQIETCTVHAAQKSSDYYYHSLYSLTLHTDKQPFWLHNIWYVFGNSNMYLGCVERSVKGKLCKKKERKKGKTILFKSTLLFFLGDELPQNFLASSKI